MEFTLFDFIASIPDPDHPAKGAPLTERQEHGKKLFGQANCTQCHTGETFTSERRRDHVAYR